MSFAQLRKDAENLDAIREQVIQKNSDGNKYLQIGIDQSGNGYCKVRIMPAPEGESSPRVKQERFHFENGAKTYSNLSRKNLGEYDPVQPYLGKLWEDGSEAAKKIYKERKKKVRDLVNVYVIEDKVNPENDGKVFLCRVVNTIDKLLKEALDPQADKFTGEKAEAFNPFDLFGKAGGRDLVIRIFNEDGNNNYSKSHFEKESTAFLGGDEAKMEEAWKMCHPLAPLVDPARHKPYDVLLEELITVVGPEDRYLKAAYPDEVAAFIAEGKGGKSKARSIDQEIDEKKTDSPEKEEPVRKEKKPEVTQSSSDNDDDFDF